MIRKKRAELFQGLPVFAILSFFSHCIYHGENNFPFMACGEDRMSYHMESTKYYTWHLVGAQKCCFPSLWIYDFNLGLIHKTALTYNESSSLKQSMMTGIEMASDTNLMVDYLSLLRGEEDEVCMLQKSRSNRPQIEWVELGLPLSREKWFNNCGGLPLLFCIIKK